MYMVARPNSTMTPFETAFAGSIGYVRDVAFNALNVSQ
jgi:hypothetical protein